MLAGACVEHNMEGGDIDQKNTADDFSPLDIRTAASRAGVSPHTLRRAIDAGEIPVVRKGRRVKVWPVDVNKWSSERGAKQERALYII